MAYDWNREHLYPQTVKCVLAALISSLFLTAQSCMATSQVTAIWERLAGSPKKPCEVTPCWRLWELVFERNVR